MTVVPQVAILPHSLPTVCAGQAIGAQQVFGVMLVLQSSPAGQLHVAVPPQALVILPQVLPVASAGHVGGAQQAPALHVSPAGHVLQLSVPPHPFGKAPHCRPPMLTVAHVNGWQQTLTSHVSPAGQLQVTLAPQALVIFPHALPTPSVGHVGGAQHAPALQLSPAAHVLQLRVPPQPLENEPHCAPIMLTVAHVSGLQQVVTSHVSPAGQLHVVIAPQALVIFPQAEPVASVGHVGGAQQAPALQVSPAAQVLQVIVPPQLSGNEPHCAPPMFTLAQVRGVQHVPAVPLVLEEHLPAAHGQLTEFPPQPSASPVPHFPA